MKKVGLLVECGRQGLETIVCRRICKLLVDQHGADIRVEIVPMDNKEKLIKGCGGASEALLKSGCDKVVILWDERPAWPDKQLPLCWHRDRSDIYESLAAHNVNTDAVGLVCIEREFESWMLFDDGAINRVLSRTTHPVSIGRQNNPDRLGNPKGRMGSLVKQNTGRLYVDLEFGPRFARELQDLNRLKRCKTFQRFAKKIAAVSF